jgi:hypothetical protein
VEKASFQFDGAVLAPAAWAVTAGVGGTVVSAAISTTVAAIRTAARAISARRTRERLPLPAAVHLRLAGMIRSSN